MSLEELKEKAVELSEQERLELICAIAQSIKGAQRDEEWQFLAPRAQSWRKQLYVKGTRLPASVIWSDRIANNMTIEEAADDWDLPIDVVQEAIRYCETNRELLDLEAEEEGKHLAERGVSLEPVPAN